MRLIAALALSLWLALGAATPALADPWQLARSDVFSVRSRDGHEYRVFVAWPDEPPPPEGWPVLWVLDGEDNFTIAVATARRLARARERSGVGPGLIVGVDSGPRERRSRDFTPAVPGYVIPEGVPAAGLPIGGADAFLDVLFDQAVPAVAARWRFDRRRQTLMGHSFGGLVALHALLTGRFRGNVAAVSPSLWYGDGVMDREERAFTPTPERSVVYIASGDERELGIRLRPTPAQLVARLNRRGFNARYRHLPGFGHGQTMLAAMGDGIAVAFSDPVPARAGSVR